MTAANIKAEELIEKFRLLISHMTDDTMTFSATDEIGNDITDDCKIDAYNGALDEAIQCALIAVEELIDSYSAYTGMYDQEFFDSELKYWLSVKQHLITKL